MIRPTERYDLALTAVAVFAATCYAAENVNVFLVGGVKACTVQAGVWTMKKILGS